MNTTRQPLLTEEQIERMLEYANDTSLNWDKEDRPNKVKSESLHFIWYNYKHIYEYIYDFVNPTVVGMDLFLAFLRGKTKRVLNLDRLRADVKAWLDDPNRKYPEWMLEGSPEVCANASYVHIRFLDRRSHLFEVKHPEILASVIGINPDDYFEEQIIE